MSSGCIWPPKVTIIFESHTAVFVRDRLNPSRYVLYVYLSQVPLNQEGYYYHFQLIGLKVINEDLGFLGNITEILQTGANDVYVIHNNDSELLIPAIKSVVLSVDLPKKEMLVKIPDGLDSRPLK